MGHFTLLFRVAWLNRDRRCDRWWQIETSGDFFFLPSQSHMDLPIKLLNERKMLSFFPCLFFTHLEKRHADRPTDRVLRESIAHTRTAVGYVPALSLPVSITQTPTRPDTGNQEVMSWLHFLFSFSPFSNHRIRQLFVVIQGTRMKIVIIEQGFLFLLCLNYCAQPICVGPSTQKMAAVSSSLCYFFFSKDRHTLAPRVTR